MRKRRLPRSSPNGRILPSSRTSHWMHRHRVFCEWVLFTVLCFSPAGTTAGVAASTDSFPALLPPLTAGATAANFPPHPSSPWYDVNMGTSSDSDGDNELESSSDFEEVELGASSLSGLNNSATTDTRFGTNRNNHSNRSRSHAHPRKDLEQLSTESFEHGNSSLKKGSTNRRNRPSLLNQNDELAAPGNDKKYPASRVGTKQIETSGSQPLQTLQKLQQMLDETGYMTSKPRKSETGPQQFAQASTAVSVHEKTTSTSKNAFTDSRSLPNVVEHKVDVKAEALAISTAAASLRSTVSASQSDLNPLTTKSPVPEPTEKLWTSQDRSKYKRQQYLLRKARAEQKDLQHRNTRLSSEPNIPPPPPPRMTSTEPQHFSYYQQTNRYRQAPHFQPAVSEDEENAYTDDGLGYTLPNLPVYYSDNEGESEEVAEEFAKSTTIQELPWQQFPAESSSMQSTIANPHSAVFRPPQYVRTLPHDYLSQQQPYIQQQNNHHHHQQQQQPYTGYNSNHHVPYTPHRYPYQYSTYGYGPPPQQGYTATQGAYTGLYGPQWVQSNHPNYGNYPGTHSSPPQHSQSHFESPPQILKEVPNTGNARMASSTINPSKAGHQLSALAMPKQSATALPTSVGTHPMETSQLGFGTSQSLAEASARISFDAIQQISFMMMMTALLCYSAVSPRTLPLTEYNLRFYENIQSVSLSAVVPIISMVSVFDARENDVNRIVNTFFFSFTLGYTMAFAGEVVMATVVRLLTFFWFEPNIFSLTPMVPVPILPWVLRECKYRPKRITLLAADFGTSCVAAPFIEEYMKLKIVQWFVDLPRNFNWSTRISSRSKKRRRIAEAVVRGPAERDIVSANQYVTHMLAASLGMKLCDAGRRILMYTKVSNENKSFYAICRGIFPIHELCGTMTALALAKRDLLGVDLPVWRMLLPATIVHGMANLRGMKPIFKWNSATPWSEMQLSPLNVPDASTLPQLLKKGYAKLMWAIILARVLGYCIKNYYMVNRQAVKRTTTYAGNHAAFSAELATAEVLKQKK